MPSNVNFFKSLTIDDDELVKSKTADPAGQKRPNSWALHDIHGNVWGWRQDELGGYTSGFVDDPSGAGDGSGRVGRGGSGSKGPACGEKIKG